MRSFLIFLVVIILGIVGSTFIVGDVSEKRFREILNTIDKIPGASVEIQSYEKHLFYSRSRFAVKMWGGLTYQINSVIHHGPIVFQPIGGSKGFKSPVKFLLASINNELESVSSISTTESTPPLTTPTPPSTSSTENSPQNLSENQSTNQTGANTESTPETNLSSKNVLKPPIPIVWVVDVPYAGNLKISSQSQPFEVSKEQIFIKSTGWNTQGYFSRDGARFDTDTKMEEIAFGKYPERIAYLVFKGINTKNEFSQSQEVRSSKSVTTMDKIYSPVFPVEANGLTLEFDLLAHAATFDFIFGFTANSIQIERGQPSFGPEKFVIKVENIDLESAKALAAKSGSNSLSDAEAHAMLNKILQNKPKISLQNVELNFPSTSDGQMPKGRIELNATAIAGDVPVNEPLMEYTNFNQILKTVNGELNAKITKDLFHALIMNAKMNEIIKDPNLQNMNPDQRNIAVRQSVDQIISEFKREGILIENADNYQIKLNITQGQLVSPVTGIPLERVGSRMSTNEGEKRESNIPAAPNTVPAPPVAPVPAAPVVPDTVPR